MPRIDPDDSEDEECECEHPKDNDEGYCMWCGNWINYKYRNNP